MAAKQKLVSDFNPISGEEETKCSDDLWEYIEAHEDELEDLEAYARNRGLTKH
jgi:hypothetical protein